MPEKGENTRKKGSLKRRGEGLGTGPVGNGPRGDKAGSQLNHGQGTQHQQSQTSHQTQQGYTQQSHTQNQQSTGGWNQVHQQPKPTGSQSFNQQPKPTGSQSFNQQPKPTGTQNLNSQPNSTGGRASSGFGGLKRIIFIVIAIIVLIIIWRSCHGCGGGSNTGYNDYSTDPYVLTTAAPSSSANLTTAAQETEGSYETYGDLSSILSGLGLGNMIGTAGTGSYNADVSQLSSGSCASFNTWTDANGNPTATGNTNPPNTATVQNTRAKYTTIKGGGQDTVTIMVFMCGTDLESNYKMGTSDLQEMLNSNCGGNVNLIVYTGGCRKWQNNVVSNSVNQIYQVKNGQLLRLSDNAGTGAMTDPNTLAQFIQICAQNFPANRYELIMWDHGGGSVSGYGYDEKQKNHDTMDLSEISQALKAGGVKFDFIGFDACLMATTETALMLNDYGDYMIASEESEPGIGWDYTEWLKQLSGNTSIDTVSLGRKIADDFVTQCAKSCRGQATTLSVVDLSEFAAAVPQPLASFASNTANLVSSDYQTVSSARSRTHEFAASSKIDQIDLVHFAKNMGTAEGRQLAEALLSAIKYNTTSSDVTNAYGISIYFPYRRTSYVDKAVKTYSAIGLNDAYSKCIQSFAAMGSAGQMATGGTAGYSSSLLDLLGGGQQQSSSGTLLDLLGGTSSSSSYSSSSSSSDLISGLLGSYLGGGSSSSSGSGLGSLLTGLSGDNSSFLFGRATEDPNWIENTSEYIADNMIEREKLNWTKNADGEEVLALTQEDWKLLTDLQTSVYYDDGEGYIDLGTDQIYSFDKYGNLAMPETKNWMAIVGTDANGDEVEQPVAYYLDSVVRNGSSFTLTGRVPVIVNSIYEAGNEANAQEVGIRANLILVFTDKNPKGYIAGVQPVYTDGTEVEAKNYDFIRQDENGNELQVGYNVDFICDYYNYDGEYLDSYMLGDSSLSIEADTEIVPYDLEELGLEYLSLMYRFTDIYNQVYWSEVTR